VQFWLVVSDLYTITQAKRVYAFIVRRVHDRAQAEEQKALSLAGSLSAEDRGLIQGRLYEFASEWDKAASFYLSLRTLYQDELLKDFEPDATPEFDDWLVRVGLAGTDFRLAGNAGLLPDFASRLIA
jgi:hypothetical protein